MGWDTLLLSFGLLFVALSLIQLGWEVRALKKRLGAHEGEPSPRLWVVRKTVSKSNGHHGVFR